MSYRVDEATVRIGGATLLDHVSIELTAGRIVAVAGPNGAGKSTLIGVLAGDRRPSGGSASLGGRSLTDWPRGELARRRAVMGTAMAVAFGFSAREVALMGRMPIHGGAPTEADDAIVDALFEAVDCTDLADRTYATLSTGERQRVSLARAIAQLRDTGEADGAERYLLLDEPTSSLDPAHQHTAMRLVREVAASGVGVLAVLHDLNLAAAYADTIVLMRQARVVAAGPPAEVLRPEVLESVFDIPMLVLPHPHLDHPLVVAEPAGAPTRP